MKKEAVAAGYKLDPTIGPDRQIRRRRWPQFSATKRTPDRSRCYWHNWLTCITSTGKPFACPAEPGSSWTNWWPSPNSLWPSSGWQEWHLSLIKFSFVTLVFECSRSSLTGKVPRQRRVCKQYTARRTLCTRNIFSRVAQDKAAVMVSLGRIVHHSRASCIIRPRRCLNTIFHTTLRLFQIIHTFHLSFLQSHGDYPIPPNPRTAGLFGCFWLFKVRLQVGDTTNARVLFTAHTALDEECDNMICVLKSVANLVKGNNFGMNVQGLVEDSREKLAGALSTFISVGNVRALVTMGELGLYKEVQVVVSLQFRQ